MSTTFAAARRENAESGLVFGQAGHFGVPLVYRPAAGGPERTVLATLADDDRRDDETGYGAESRERIWVTVCKDETCARGGVAAPAEGDCLTRPGDDPAVPWSFQDEIRRETDYGWELLFARHRPRRYGPRQ